MSTEGLHEQVSNVEFAAVGPGVRLRSCRETTDWTVEDVARHLRLKPHVIEGIENDDYSNPPQMVFLRGYLRAYAKLLNLPEDEIIASFNALHVQDEVKAAPVLKRVQPVQSVSYSTIGGISAVVIVVIGLIAWLATDRSAPAPVVKPTEVVDSVKVEPIKAEPAKPAEPARSDAMMGPAATESLPADTNAAPALQQPVAPTAGKRAPAASNKPQKLNKAPKVDDLSDLEGTRSLDEDVTQHG